MNKYQSSLLTWLVGISYATRKLQDKGQRIDDQRINASPSQGPTPPVRFGGLKYKPKMHFCSQNYNYCCRQYWPCWPGQAGRIPSTCFGVFHLNGYYCWRQYCPSWPGWPIDLHMLSCVAERMLLLIEATWSIFTSLALLGAQFLVCWARTNSIAWGIIALFGQIGLLGCTCFRVLQQACFY